MRRIRRHHLTFANVASAIALFVALGGGTAVALNGTNTVQSDDLGPGAQVKAADVAANAVNGSKVQDGSIAAADTNTASLQRRVSGTCPSGKAATSVTQIGGLTCDATDGGVARGVDALFGDGSDGDQTIASDTTLSRDTYYHNLTIDPGTTLNPGGFRIFVSGTLTLGDGAAIARDGEDGGSSGNGAPALGSGTLGGSAAGASAGTSPSPVVNSLGGVGGVGSAGGPGGSAMRPSPAAGGAQVFRQALSALSGRSLDGVRVNGGGGGGVGASGGGGAGGGVVIVVARSVMLGGSAAAITANGGAGHAIGGGGGGGGLVVVITSTAKPGGFTLRAAGGSGDGAGISGAPGFTAWLD